VQEKANYVEIAELIKSIDVDSDGQVRAGERNETDERAGRAALARDSLLAQAALPSAHGHSV
jgi:hypothetical protein